MLKLKSVFLPEKLQLYILFLEHKSCNPRLEKASSKTGSKSEKNHFNEETDFMSLMLVDLLSPSIQSDQAKPEFLK